MVPTPPNMSGHPLRVAGPRVPASRAPPSQSSLALCWEPLRRTGSPPTLLRAPGTAGPLARGSTLSSMPPELPDPLPEVRLSSLVPLR
ncbi:MAG: hypothetical protein J2P37_31640, partial [Ktedonobacteraceae bacterium]|nr:hypothetical protein [Ktedonobacteraceae bacterium]